MNAVAFYVKNPNTQTVKEKLAAEIGPIAAQKFYEECLNCLRSDLLNLPSEYQKWICPSTLDDVQWAAETFQTKILPQTIGDLGTRLSDTYRRLKKMGYEKILILGSDAPTLPLRFIDECVEALEESDLVLGPTENGNFYLIGGRILDFSLDLADVRWNTVYSFEDTKSFFKASGLQVATGPHWYGIEEAADLRKIHRAADPYSRQGALKDFVKDFV